MNYSIAARAAGALIGVLATIVFAACTPTDGPASGDQGTEQSGGY